MSRLSLILVLLTATGQADVRYLATNYAGDLVYFTTQHRPVGSNHSQDRKAYRWTSGGVSLIQDGGSAYPRSVRETRDGSILAINTVRPCRSGSVCISEIQEWVEFRPRGSAFGFNVAGEGWIAPDGSAAVVERSTGFGFLPNPNDYGLKRVDLNGAGRQLVRIGSRPAYDGQWFADDGSILIASGQGPGVRLWRQDGTIDTFLGETLFGTALLSRDGDTVISCSTAANSSAPAGPIRLSRRTGGFDEIVGVGVSISWSTDESRLLYLAPAEDETWQVFLMELPARTSRQVTAEGDGYEEATMSGDGRLAFAVTTDGRLHRIDLSDDYVEDIIGPMPNIDRGAIVPGFNGPETRSVTPGSTHRLQGTGLVPETVIAPSPASTKLAGISVLVAGHPAAILWAAPWEIGYQVAWETPVSSDPSPGEPYIVVRTDDSKWEELLRVTIGLNPKMAWVDPETAASSIVHQDFDRLVSINDPARPGEYVHIYATGLGPVAPTVATGAPAPTELPLPELTSTCQWQAAYNLVDPQPPAAPLEVPYAGLAPGLTGFYQVVVRIPEDWQDTALPVRCGPIGNPFVVPVAP